MRAVITGARGTVGRALTAHLESHGNVVIPWDRALVPVDNYGAMEAFLARERPDAVFHLALASQSTGRENEGWIVNQYWPSELAWATRQQGIPFIFTSTVMVFTGRAKGPFRIDDIPDADEGYGLDKLRAEERVMSQNPDARVVRLGWQIGSAPGTNNMLDFFHQRTKEGQPVRASTLWYPACSFLEDTAQVLAQIPRMPGGIYHLNGNKHWQFHEIATALLDIHPGEWTVDACEDFAQDQRMIDDRLDVPGIENRLPKLKRR